jgi:hypothetical protein
MYYVITKKMDTFLNNPYKLLIPIGIIYIIFFSVFTYETFNAPFLIDIREAVIKAIT